MNFFMRDIINFSRGKPGSSMEKINISRAEIKLIGQNMVRIEYMPDTHIDLPHLEEALQAYRKLVGNEKFYALTVINPGVTVSDRARKYWASAERSRIKIAEAFVINRLTHVLIANFVTSFQPPKHPLKFFKTEKQALVWLKAKQK